MAKFKPTWIVCLKNCDSFKYECRATHLNEQGHSINNTYRFTGKPLKYLVKNQEDYDEMIALSLFEDYIAPEEKPVSAPSETSKEKKLREKTEAKAAKEAAKKAKEEEEMVPVPAEQTDGASTITERPASE